MAGSENISGIQKGNHRDSNKCIEVANVACRFIIGNENEQQLNETSFS